MRRTLQELMAIPVSSFPRRPNRRRPAFPTCRRLAFESLERRKLLATDIAVTGFSSNGEDLVVEYDIAYQDAMAFDIGIYRSSDGQALGTRLTSERVTGQSDLQVGIGHCVAVDAYFTDVEQDYYLIAKVDSSSEISEESETNNERLFEGGVFLATDGTVHVHGTTAADTITVSVSGDWEVSLNSVGYEFASGEFSAIHVRSHAGNDSIYASSATKPLWVFSGEDDDYVYCGSSNDMVYGGAGDDVHYGEAGDDLLYGEAGDDLLYGEGGADLLEGGYGSDTLYGHDGTGSGYEADSVYGGAGDDLLYGEAGDDLLYGDGEDDYLDGGYGDDTLYGDDGTGSANGGADNAYGGAGNDMVFGEAGDDILFGDDGTGSGYGGDDSLYGSTGNDGLYGESGDDYLVGGAGVDTLNAGGQEGDIIADAPTISSFRAVEGPTLWTFTGTVTDDDVVVGLTITFGGILSGYTATVMSDGSFEFSIDLEQVGTVTAQTTDFEGLDSDLVWTIVT